jgi:membrane protein DedA with SNARE-associated domain
MAELLDQVRIIIENIVATLGYPGIALTMFAENIFTPIPSELVMPFAGFLVAEDRLNFWGVMLAGTLGSVAGALAIYYLGMWADEPVIRSLVRRYGRFLLISENDLDRALGTFDRYGDIIIFAGRLVPLVRSAISLPAGMNRMPLGKFLLYTTLGSGLWTALLGYAGVVLGENWEDVLILIKKYQLATTVGLIIAVILFFALRIWNMYQTGFLSSGEQTD